MQDRCVLTSKFEKYFNHKILFSARVLFILFLSAATVALASSALSRQPPSATPNSVNLDINVSEIGPEEIVYRWASRSCDDQTMPDAATRAFIDDSGNTRVFASSNANLSLTGPNLNSVTTDCRSTFKGAETADIGAFDDRGWIEGTFTIDGKHVAALVSNEWNAYRHPETALAKESDCNDPHEQNCYFYSINEAISIDGGAHFTYPKKGNVVAAPPRPFSRIAGDTSSQGFATSSNIFAYEGWYYAFLGARGGGDQPKGNCLIRTRDPFDSASWRAWDGQDFTISFGNPYKHPLAHPTMSVCKTIQVPNGQFEEVRSVSWYQPLRIFIATMRGRLRPEDSPSPVTGIFYAISMDLINWSSPKLLMPLKTLKDCGPMIVYPSILDPRSKDRNYTEITNHPYLYYTKFNIDEKCKLSMDRDLIRRRIEIITTNTK